MKQKCKKERENENEMWEREGKNVGRNGREYWLKRQKVRSEGKNERN